MKLVELQNTLWNIKRQIEYIDLGWITH